MAIGPIPNLGPLATMQPAGASSELPAVARVDDAARAGKYSSGRRQSPARQDDEPVAASAEPESTPQILDVSAPDANSGTRINLFA